MRRRAAIQLFLAEPEPPVYSFNAMRAAGGRETLTIARRAVND
jgi:hypothetical protein